MPWLISFSLGLMRVTDSGPQRNPLRIIAVVALVSVAADLYYIFVQHRLDPLIVLRIITAPAFLALYIRRLPWAWHLTVAEGPLFLLLYWILFFFGGLSIQPRIRTASFMGFVFLFQLAILVSVLVWLFRIRDSYLRYIQDATSLKT